MEAAELDERLEMVVDPQIEDTLVRRRRLLGRDDDEPRRLPAAEIATRRFRRIESREEPLRERSRRGREGLGHPTPDVVRAEHVPLDAEPCALEVARVWDARRSRVRGGAALAVDERHLPDVAQLVLGRGARRAPRAATFPPCISASPLGPYPRSVKDCVATTPIPGSAHAHAAPVLNAHDWTATPSSAPSGSQATIE